MKKLIFIALIAYGFWHWKSNHHAMMNAKAFDASGNPIAVVYTVEGCGEACDVALTDLASRKLKYELIQVDMQNTDSDSYRAWKSLDVSGFPVIQIGKDSVVGYQSSDIRRMVADNFGHEHLTPKERYYYRQHFDADGNPQVVLYGTSWCGYCKKLRQDLQTAGIPFQDVDVEAGGSVNQDMASTMGIGGYPTVYVGYQRIQDGTKVDQIKAALKA